MSGEILREATAEVATLTISNPSKRNALSVKMWLELRRYMQVLSEDSDLRCVLLRGASPDAFSAGADISEFSETRSTYEQVVRFHEDFVLGCLKAIAACPVPVVAAIQGACFGGGLEIATMCDIRIAEIGARFGAPVGRMGFPLAFGETEALVRLVGPSVAAELLIEGRIFDAQEAHEKGIVARVVSPDCFQQEVDHCIENIRQSGSFAARSHKRQIRRLMTDASPVSTEERMEVYKFVETADYHRGIETFLAKGRGLRS